MERPDFGAVFRGFLRFSNGVALLCIVLVVWLACVVRFHRPYVGDFMDDGEYFVAAQSLRDRRGYRLPSRPGNPPELKYPAGLSLLTAAFLPSRGVSLESDFRAARAGATAAALVFATASFATLAVLGVPGVVAACCVAPALWSETVLSESLTLLSDVPFAACCAVAALAWALLRRGVIKPAGGLALSLGFVAGASLAIRSNGVALCVACLALALEAPKRARFAGFYLVGVSLLPVLAKLATRASASATPAEPYSVNWIAYSSVRAAVSIVLHNIVDYTRAVPVLFVPELTTNLLSRHSVLTAAIRLAVWAVIVRGVWLLRHAVRRVDLAPILFCLITAAICMIWPWSLYLRPIVPFMPFAIAVFFVGLRFHFVRKPAFAELGLAAVLVLCGAQFFMTARSLRHPGFAWNDAFSFIRRETQADAVFVTQFPETVYLYTGRQAVKLLSDRDMVSQNLGHWASVYAWTQSAHGRALYILGPLPAPGAADTLARQVAALAASAPGRLREIYRSKVGDLAIFEVGDHI